MKKDEVVRILRSSILFKNLEQEKMNAIAEICTVRYLKSGETVFRQGEYATHFHVVGIGEVGLVLTQPNGAETIVGRIAPGGHFGENVTFDREAACS